MKHRLIASVAALSLGILPLAVLPLASPALANDTMAELRTGGLAYVMTSDVAMVEEDLFLSMDEVRVDYVFQNNSDKDVESIIAFPMPDIAAQPNVNIAIPDFEADNFLGFSVIQDGKAIKPELQQRVSALSVDYTELLKSRNVPLLPYSEKTLEALKTLSPDVLKDWEAKGLVFPDTYDAGQGMQTVYTPMWTMQSVYWWKTKFPVKKPVRVSHRYKPSVGGTVAISFLSEDKTNETYASYKDRYCIDDAFLKTAVKLEKASQTGGPYYTESWLSYVLKTGANWGGTIGKFKLTIDKGKPENYLSLCANGIKKTGPTTFVMEKTDFWPEKDLDILLLVAGSPMQR